LPGTGNGNTASQVSFTENRKLVLGLSAAGQSGHIQGCQELHCDAIVKSIGARWVDTHNLPPTSENKMISLLGKAGVVGSVDVEINDVTLGKSRGLFTLKIDSPQADVFEKPRAILRFCRLRMAQFKFQGEKFGNPVMLALIHNYILKRSKLNSG